MGESIPMQALPATGAGLHLARACSLLLAALPSTSIGFPLTLPRTLSLPAASQAQLHTVQPEGVGSFLQTAVFSRCSAAG